MIAVEVRQYLTRARDFLEGMKFLGDDLAQFKSSSALLGIHCAISYIDALRIGLGCSDVSSEDHRNAGADLRSRLAAKKHARPEGVNHLDKLLSRKSRVAYSAYESTRNEVGELLKHANRFASWAESVGTELKIEGWRDD